MTGAWKKPGRPQRLVPGAQARWLGHGGIELAGYLAGQLKSAGPACASGGHGSPGNNRAMLIAVLCHMQCRQETREKGKLVVRMLE